MPTGELTLRPPTPGDGAAMWRIACEVGLDRNSPYKYLVFCRDFADTSMVAVDGDEPVGFLTGYRRPADPETLFVWQVGVVTAQRGRRVATVMLESLAARWLTTGEATRSSTSKSAEPVSDRVSYVEATVAPDNAASMRLFAAFAERHGAPVERSVLFPASLFPEEHADEVLLRIGPL